jgi:hypothetical protein
MEIPNPLRNLAETPMTEERKHAILFAATLLSARRLIENMNADKPDFAEEHFIKQAIRKAELVMECIDKLHPTTAPTHLPDRNIQ